MERGTTLKERKRNNDSGEKTVYIDSGNNELARFKKPCHIAIQRGKGVH